MEESWEQKIRESVEKILSGAPGCHDFAHTLRVLHNAELILQREAHTPEQETAVRLAALLHDIGRPQELVSDGKVDHAPIGEKMAPEILRSAGCFDEEMIRMIACAVGRHRFRGKSQPVTFVDKVVYDADKLDSIGAVGIGRAFHFAGRVGARLHNSAEAALAGKEYGPEDSAYREYLVKLRHVAGRMLTDAGRALAQERSAYMDDFFRRMNEGL